MECIDWRALCLLPGATLVLSDDDLDLDLPDVEGPKLSDIPGFDSLPFNKSNLPDPAEVERVFREKCIKAGGEEAFEAAKVLNLYDIELWWTFLYNNKVWFLFIQNAKQRAEECLKGLIDFKQLTEEMEKAKPTGDLDEVFRKYCKWVVYVLKYFWDKTWYFCVKQLKFNGFFLFFLENRLFWKAVLWILLMHQTHV